MARDMDRWLGDGGMALLGSLGVDLTSYGEGWVEGDWTPTELACNPNGPVQGGTYGVVFDGVMTFATLAALEKGESCSSLEMKMSWLRGATAGDELGVRGEVVRITRSVAFCEAAVTNREGETVARASATALLRRK